ncbi:MAG TPA: GYF domain-containing protein [Tepidisphaeraceae bacterium]|jgi:hypothetical protein|nr:GYF domain-containing protein [Tepidisphaeraceae bacterium]
MSNYWVKRTDASTSEGPYSGSQLKAMAASGQLTEGMFVSADQAKWTAAARVKGLFAAPSPAAAPFPPAPQSPPAPSSQSQGESWQTADGAQYDAMPQPPPFVRAQTSAIAPPAVPAPASLAYASYVGGTNSFVGRPRNVKWYLISSIVILGMIALQILFTVITVATVFGSVRSGAPSRPMAGAFLVMTFAGLAMRMIAFFGFIGLHIYFIVWLYLVHDDVRKYTNGAYPISPGQACGFCFIPFFNLYWIVYAPYKLAEFVDQQLGSTKQITNPVTVMVFQILQQVVVFPCMCVYSPSPIFNALSMRSIQEGLNQIWSNGGPVPPSSGPPYGGAYAPAYAAPVVRQFQAQTSAAPANDAPPVDASYSMEPVKKGMPRWAWLTIIIGGSVLAVAAAVGGIFMALWPAFSRVRAAALQAQAQKNAAISSANSGNSAQSFAAPAGSTELLAGLDVAAYSRAGSWRTVGAGVQSSGQGVEMIGIPYHLPEACNLNIEFVRHSGNEELGLNFQEKNRSSMLLVGAQHDTRIGIDMVGSMRSPGSGKGPRITPAGEVHRLVVKIRKDSVDAMLDGKFHYHVSAKFSNWKLAPKWNAGSGDTLGLGTSNSSIEFRSLTVSPADGH